MTLKGNGLNSVWNDAFSVASLAHMTIILRPKSSASTDAAAMVRILLHSPAVGWTIMGRFIIMKYFPVLLFFCKCPIVETRNNCSLICRQFTKYPFQEKSCFYLDYGCLSQRCGMKLSSVSVTVITSCLHLLKPLFFFFVLIDLHGSRVRGTGSADPQQIEGQGTGP